MVGEDMAACFSVRCACECVVTWTLSAVFADVGVADRSVAQQRQIKTRTPQCVHVCTNTEKTTHPQITIAFASSSCDNNCDSSSRPHNSYSPPSSFTSPPKTPVSIAALPSFFTCPTEGSGDTTTAAAALVPAPPALGDAPPSAAWDCL